MEGEHVDDNCSVWQLTIPKRMERALIQPTICLRTPPLRKQKAFFLIRLMCGVLLFEFCGVLEYSIATQPYNKGFQCFGLGFRV